MSVVPLSERLALSVEEAGSLLGISRDLAYDLVASREIPSVRLGRRVVVPRRALEEALERLLTQDKVRPRLLRWRGCFPVGGVEEVGVGAEGDAGVGMAEASGDGADADAAGRPGSWR